MATQHAYLIFSKVRYDRIRFSDGSSRLVGHGTGQQTRDQLLRAASLSYDQWRAQQPTFWSDAHRAEQWKLYEQSVSARRNEPTPHGEVESVRGWLGTFTDASGAHSVTDVIESWHGGVPAQEIVATLDKFNSEGWQVVATTEDKGLYAGIDTGREAGPVTIRILVKRET